ncbi:Rad52/Rad22 family DNA repair protein [Nocardiopsis terrae]|uniref:Rad52/Rad22 family DNA repair protein n=1 Tax=Streptomyces sp. NPDC057554 TaxID=3350538 RepID=UPI00368E0196
MTTETVATSGHNTLTPRPYAGPQALTTQQVAYLLGQLNPRRVRKTQGNSYVEGWDIRRALTHVFGFGGWELETTELKCVREHGQQSKTNNGNSKTRWWVTYRAQARLTVKTPDGRPISFWEDGAVGESANQPSNGDAHDMAMKTALTGALKRCAVNLGDQFGLSLYRDGSPAPVIIKSLPHKAGKASTEDPGPGVAENPADMSEVGGTQEAPEETPPAPAPAPAPRETAPPAPEETPEAWAKKFNAALPGADLDKLNTMQADLTARLKAKWLPVPEARTLMTALNRRRAEAKQAAKAGGASDAA